LIKYEQGDINAALKHWQAALTIEKQAAEPQLAMAVALYVKGDQQRAITMGESALRIDQRYGDVQFLRDQLWGDRLIADTQKLLASPRIQAALQEPPAQPAQIQVIPQ